MKSRLSNKILTTGVAVMLLIICGVISLQQSTSWIRNEIFCFQEYFPTPFLTIEELLRFWTVDPLAFLLLGGFPAFCVCSTAFLYRFWRKQGGQPLSYLQTILDVILIYAAIIIVDFLEVFAPQAMVALHLGPLAFLVAVFLWLYRLWSLRLVSAEKVSSYAYILLFLTIISPLFFLGFYIPRIILDYHLWLLAILVAVFLWIYRLWALQLVSARRENPGYGYVLLFLTLISLLVFSIFIRASLFLIVAQYTLL